MPPESNTDAFAKTVSAAIRGPSSLRSDIEDEIADHLATRIESASANDAEAEQKAIRAFGDPAGIASELRHIHLGERIMFQRIMTVALIAVVAGMAFSTYLSWSAAAKTNEQFAQMNDRLASLVELQRNAARLAEEKGKPPQPVTPVPTVTDVKPSPTTRPNWVREAPRLRVKCVIAPNNKPAAHYPVEIWAQPPPGKPVESKTFTTDEHGMIAEPVMLQPNTTIRGNLLCAGKIDTSGHRVWFRYVRQVNGFDRDNVHVVTVGTEYERDVRLKLPADISWDPQRMKNGTLSFRGTIGDPKDSFTGNDYIIEDCPIKLMETNRVGCLLPGEQNVSVGLPGFIKLDDSDTRNPNRVHRQPQPSGPRGPKDADEFTQVPLGSITVPKTADPLIIPLEVKPENRIAGVIFIGSRDHPLAHNPVTVHLSNPPREEHVITDAQGRFVVFNPPISSPFSSALAGLFFDWKRDDGHTVHVAFPIGTYSGVRSYDLVGQGRFHEIDLSKLETLRMNFTGMDTLKEPKYRWAGPPEVKWFIGTSPRRQSPPEPTYPRLHDARLAPATGGALEFALFEGAYDLYAVLPLIEFNPASPELEQFSKYSRVFQENKVKAGQLTEIEIPVTPLDKWAKGQPEWRPHATTHPAS